MPEGWRWARLGGLADFINGAAFKPADWHGEGTPIIRIQNLTNPEKAPNLTRRVLPAKYVVEAGDILLSWSATLDVFEWRGRTAWLNQHIFKIADIRDDIDKRYFRFLLKNEVEALKRSEHLHGSTMMHINRGPFMAHPVPVPPLSMQKLIAARIDALFAEIDEGEAALAEARAGVETYRKALLKAAVTGELTADWRRDNPPQETGEQLLARILADRRARWHADPKNARKKYVEPTGPNTDGLPELPEGWTWANLDQLSTHEVRNGLSVRDVSEPTEVRALRLSALSGSEVDWSVFRYLPRTLASVQGYLLQDGDMLVSRANGSPELVGKASLCVAPATDIIFPDTAIRYRLLGGPDLRQWIVRVWNSLLVRHQIGKLAKTTAGILKVSQSDISRIAVPIPSEMEMCSASRLVGEGLSMAAHDDLMHQIGGSACSLRHSILAAAFRGELAA